MEENKTKTVLVDDTQKFMISKSARRLSERFNITNNTLTVDDIYNVSLGGFKKIGGVARDAIYNDLALATFYPIGSIVPYYTPNYIYNHYRLSIPQAQNSITWIYSIEDDSWTRAFRSNCNFTGQARWSYVS